MGHGKPHSCEEVAAQELKLRPGLKNEPLLDSQHWLYTDGCCYKGENGNVVTYAVMEKHTDSTHTEVDSGIIPQPASAQMAEILALTKALQWSKGKRLNIYTDSAYAHGAVHIDGPQWKKRNFLTTSKTPVKHKDQLVTLLEAVKAPAAVAIMKCKGHDKADTRVAKGNEAADQRAKEVGGCTPRQMTLQPEGGPTELTTENIKDIQEEARTI